MNDAPQRCFLIVGPAHFRGHATELLAVPTSATLERVAVRDVLGMGDDDALYAFHITWGDGDGGGLEFHTPLLAEQPPNPTHAFNLPTQYMLRRLREESAPPPPPPQEREDLSSSSSSHTAEIAEIVEMDDDDEIDEGANLRACTVVTGLGCVPLTHAECNWLRQQYGLIGGGGADKSVF